MNSKSKLHPRSKHRQAYDFEQLTTTCPELTPFVHPNDYGNLSINFFNPEAVKLLNKALLQHHYSIQNWDIPDGYLCPPIPGRADYIHHLADVLATCNRGKIPHGRHITCLDVGVGANCIYPLIGHQEYAWSFIGSEINDGAMASAQRILAANPSLQVAVEIRQQRQENTIFKGILKANERIDAVLCNPPFHKSKAAARAATRRKLTNLKGRKVNKTTRNFGGQHQELWCEGGEVTFVQQMIQESRSMAQNCCWFSSLISKEAHLKQIYAALKKANVRYHKSIPMGQGNKISRVVVWTFLSKTQQETWAEKHW